MNSWKDYYQNWTNQPVASHSTGRPADVEHFDRIARHIATTLQIDCQRDTVLDVGCASGMITHRLSSQARHLVGMDFIEDLVRLGATQRQRPNTTYINADASKLPFRPCCFDKIYCYAVISQLPDHAFVRECIEQMLRATKPGGRVFVGSVIDYRRKCRFTMKILQRPDPLAARLRAVAGVWLPPKLKNTLRRLAGLHTERAQMPTLWFRPQWFRQIATDNDWDCAVLDQPSDLHDSWHRFDVVFQSRGK